MATMPQEPQAFAESVAQMLRKRQPEYSVQLVSPQTLTVDGRRIDLENLNRLVLRDPTRGVEIVSHYLDHLFSTESMVLANATLDFAKPRIMPRIQPETLFNNLCREQVAHVPFVNGTAIVFVVDMPHMTVSITAEQMSKWNLSIEEMDEIARKNLDKYVTELTVQMVESKDGGKAAIISEQDGYDAARLLMSSLYQRLSPQLGRDFLVGICARDMFVALTRKPESFVKRIEGRLQQDFQRLPYPISERFFVVTRDGIAGTEDSSH